MPKNKPDYFGCPTLGVQEGDGAARHKKACIKQAFFGIGSSVGKKVLPLNFAPFDEHAMMTIACRNLCHARNAKKWAETVSESLPTFYPITLGNGLKSS